MPAPVQILRELKDSNERLQEAKFDLLPPDYVPSLIRTIEGFRINVSSIEGVFKLSQNRDRNDFANTILELKKRGSESALVADEMLARRPKYFPDS